MANMSTSLCDVFSVVFSVGTFWLLWPLLMSKIASHKDECVWILSESETLRHANKGVIKDSDYLSVFMTEDSAIALLLLHPLFGFEVVDFEPSSIIVQTLAKQKGQDRFSHEVDEILEIVLSVHGNLWNSPYDLFPCSLHINSIQNETNREETLFLYMDNWCSKLKSLTLLPFPSSEPFILLGSKWDPIKYNGSAIFSVGQSCWPLLPQAGVGSCASNTRAFEGPRKQSKNPDYYRGVSSVRDRESE
ncbi:hypothetical protein VNO77_06919 [Canavalia gladiata]|uniref:Uncharacterized protein n=1 Tax=Canavalia gladiata TaxID=3824 RepID=A0AAN9M7W8_CANGL